MFEVPRASPHFIRLDGWLRILVIMQMLLGSAHFFLTQGGHAGRFQGSGTIMDPWPTMEVQVAYYLIMFLSWFGVLIYWNTARYLYLVGLLLNLWVQTRILAHATLTVMSALDTVYILISFAIVTLVWLTPLRLEYRNG